MQNLSSNINQPYVPYNIAYGNNVVSSKGLDSIKKQDNIAGKVADSYDPTTNGSEMVRSIFYSLLMSAGFVGATNWAMRPSKMTDTMTQMDAYKNSRLYRAGAWLDNTKPARWLTRQVANAKSALGKVPVPEFIKEISAKFKVGSVSPWDKTGMYSLGKSAEAMTETATYFSKLGNEALKVLKLSPRDYKKLTKILENVRLEKIDGVEAFKQMEPILKDVSAKTLSKINVPTKKLTAMLDKVFRTKPDLSLSMSKAKFFAGANNPGVIGRTFNKLSSLVGEASGGGVLGGSPFLVMNALALMTAFSSAAKAEKGDKVKAFMEDYIGFTLGSYLMSIALGIVFNKAMGVAELGMKAGAAKTLGAELGLKDPKRLQNVVIDYNKEFKKNLKLNKLIEKFEQGKVVERKGGIFGWAWRKLTGKVTFNKVASVLENRGIKVKSYDAATLEKALRKAVGNKDFKFFNALREKIQKSIKSEITMKSIFKGTNGNFFNRLGRWIVQKPLATAAKLLSTGRYTLLKNGNFIGNTFRTLKRVGGGIGRMWLIGFVLLEPFRKMFVKLSHAVFGRPKHSALDDEEKKEEKPVEEKPLNTVNSTNQNNQASQNLVDLYMKNMNLKEKQKVKTETDKLKEDTATYIPKQTLGNESFVDPALTKDLILRRDLAFSYADSAERNAKDLLARI